MLMENLNIRYWLNNENECLKILEDKNNWKHIPDLSTLPNTQLKDGMFVKYQGMIQDMQNPVFYLDKYEILDDNTKITRVESGRFRETLHCNDNETFLMDSQNNVHEERRSLYCISIPGLNTWARKCKTQAPQKSVFSYTSEGDRSKRSHDDMERSNQPNKRLHMDVENEDRPSSNVPVSNEQNETVSSLSKQNIQMDLNLPIPDKEASACLVTIYKDLDVHQVNQVIEVAGFLSIDPSVAIHSSSDSEFMDQDFSPPCSLVPRLHAVQIRPVHQFNFLKPNVFDETTTSEIVSVRDDLKLLLTQLLMGDDVAAEYLICYLISQVYSRDDGDTALGKFSLNLSSKDLSTFCNDYGKLLYNILKLLVAKSHYFDLNVKSLNETIMIPKKDYNTNRLVTGLLQLSKNTYLMIDEINLQVGQLNNTGCLNVRALSNVIQNQRMVYEFQFCDGVTFHTDIPVLIVSDSKSMLPSDCHVKLKVDPSCRDVIRETFTAALQYLKPELLDKIRAYIAWTQIAKFDISDSISEIVQKDFVEMRKENKKIDAADLHTLIVLARLLSLSHGHTELTEEMWKTAISMEKERKSR